MKDIDKVTPHPIVQMCWVVDDMDAAALQWVKMMGAGPFFRIPHIQLDELTYQASPGNWINPLLLANGAVQVELFSNIATIPLARGKCMPLDRLVSSISPGLRRTLRPRHDA
jgi:hypothetical protein